MGQLDIQWPPVRRSITQRYVLAKQRLEEDEPRSVISTRNSAALLEARDFLCKFETVIHCLNGPSRRQSVNNFAEEFLLLEIGSFPGPGFFNKEWYKTALEKRNKNRNRYISTYATESSRVRLRHLDEPAGSDYINANFIEGVPRQVDYIATQSPLPQTMAHFWQMVWEQDCRTLLMLTKLVENGKVKGEMYWPEDDDFLGAKIDSVVQDYGPFRVTQATRPRPHRNGITERCLMLQCRDDGGNLSSPREICHIQYSKWPDHGVPRSTGPLLDLLDMVADRLKAENPCCDGQPAPVIVHCSAGIGRTGTYCAVDIGLRRFKLFYNADPDTVRALLDQGLAPLELNSVQAIVKRLKQQRTGMVQTWTQYRFCFYAIHEGIRRLIEAEAVAEENETDSRRRAHEERAIELSQSREAQSRPYRDLVREMHRLDSELADSEHAYFGS